MELDQVIVKLGECGRYQRWVYHWYCMLTLSVAFHHLAQVFLAGESDHWCTLPSNSTKLNCTDYEYGGCNDVDWSRPEDDSSTKLINEAQCTMPLEDRDGNNTELVYCDGDYTFDHSRYTRTIQEDFELVCDRKAMAATAQSIYFGGVLVGSFIFGSLADWIGRKPTLLICIALQCSFGVITAFVNSFALYCLIRFIVAASSIGIFLVAFIVATELVGVKWRTVAGTMIQVYWAVGIMILALLAYLIRDWRKLQIALSIPTAIGLIYVPFLPESARWLLSQGSIKKAEAVVQKTARINKVSIPQHPFSDKLTKVDKLDRKKYTFMDLFRTPVLRLRTLNIMYNWLVIVMVYYGLSLSTANLGIDPYVAFMLTGLIEIPAYIISIFAIDRFGRRLVLSLMMLLGGLSCFSTIFLEPGIPLVVITMTGKFGLTAAFGIVYIYSAEIFPTPVRSAGMGLASMTGRVGSIISPIALYMADLWEPLPLVLFSSLSVSGGVLCLFLPETMGKKLPETLKEGEEFGLAPRKYADVYSDVEKSEEITEGSKL